MTGSALELRRTDVPAAFGDQMKMASVLAESSLLPAHLRGKPANVLVILQGARALDVAAFWAFQSMHVIEGKLGMAAELMRALVIRSGHSVRVVERSMTRAVVEVKRHDREEPYRAEFTMDDAKAARLLDRDGWKKYPKSMLVARATSIAVRDECPDVLFGVVYTPEELGAETDDEGQPIGDLPTAEVVDPLTDVEVAVAHAALLVASVEEIPAIWAKVAEHGGQFAKIGPETDTTLFDILAARVALLAYEATVRGEVRALWDLCRVLGVRGATVKVGEQEIELSHYLKERGASLPEEATPPAEEVVEATVEPDVDTDHARALREAAAASWEDQKAELADRREQVFDRLSRRHDEE